MTKRYRRSNRGDQKLTAMLGFSPAGEGMVMLPGQSEGLLHSAAALRAWAPQPARHDLEERILAAGLAAMDQPVLAARSDHSGWLALVLEAVRPQVHVFRAPFWLATLFAVAAGLPLLLTQSRAVGWLDLSFAGFLVFVAPVIAVGGTAYAFRSYGTGMAELEMTTPLTPWQLIAGRLFWVLAYDFLLLGLCSLAAVTTNAGLALGYLVAAWLIPMLALTLTDILLTAFIQPLAAAGISLAVWAGAVANASEHPWVAPLAAAGTQDVIGSSLSLLAVCVVLFAAVGISRGRLVGRIAGLLPQVEGNSGA